MRRRPSSTVTRLGLAVAAAAALAAGSSVAVAATTLSIRAPATVKVNHPYRVTVSGTAARPDLLSIFVRKSGRCLGSALREVRSGSYILTRGQFVAAGAFRLTSDKTVFTRVHRYARICAYLPANGKATSRSIASTR